MQSIAKPTTLSSLELDIPAIEGTLVRAQTDSGRALLDLVEATPVLLVFLRHAGCTFCRESLGDIAAIRNEIESHGTRIILVHMGDRVEIQKVIARCGLSDLERICDPEQRLYDAFGLLKGSWRQLFGPKVWIRGVIAGLFRGHGWNKPVADATQMPGVFYIDQAWIVRRFRHKSAADRPCYTDLCNVPEQTQLEDTQ